MLDLEEIVSSETFTKKLNFLLQIAVVVAVVNLLILLLQGIELYITIRLFNNHYTKFEVSLIVRLAIFIVGLMGTIYFWHGIVMVRKHITLKDKSNEKLLHAGFNIISFNLILGLLQVLFYVIRYYRFVMEVQHN